MTTRARTPGTLLAAALGLLAALPASARAQSVIAYTGTSCAGTRYGRDLGCTSKDFTTSASFTQPAPGLASCVAGSTITLDVIASVVSGSATRYDGAVFLGERGNDPSLEDATQSCSLGVFPSGPSPFLQLDGDGVGDYLENSTASLTITGVTAYCMPGPGSNVLALPYTLVFDNQSTPGATWQDVTAGGPAKCVNTTAAQVTGVVVQGWIRLAVETVPAADPQPFAFTASGTAAASPASFSLAAGQAQLVQIPLDPAGGTRTVQLDEALPPGWVSTADISCTTPATGAPAPYVTVDGANRRITATLDATNHGANCVVRNTKLARVTVREQSAGATGTFSFTSGTNGLPASFTLDTAAANPATAAWWVTANGAPVTVSQAIPDGWTLAGASCSDGASPVGTVAGATVSIAGAAVTAGREIACTFASTRKATLAKAFSPVQVGTGIPSTLAFTVTNRPGAPAQPDLGFTDAFPPGLVAAAPLATSTTCGGALYRGGTALPLAAGDGAITFAGGALAAGAASCEVRVAVTSAAAGSYTNGPANVTGYTGGLEGGLADQTLTVYLLPSLVAVKSADGAFARPGDVVGWTLLVQNAGPGIATDVVLSEPLSRHLALAVDAYGPGVPFELAAAPPGVSLGAPEYSADGGASWTLVPVSGGGGAPAGFDGRVTNWRIPLVGEVPGGGELVLTFRTAVE